MARGKLHGPQNDLHRAIQQGDLAAVQAWLAAGKSLEARDPTATTPLALAAFFSKPAIFHALLAAGASTAATDDGNHVLFYAAWRGNRKMVQALLDRGVDVNFQCQDAGSSGQTALIGAAKGGHLDIVKLLHAHHADPAPTDYQGNTALDHAVENDHASVVQFLKACRAPGKAAARQRPAKPHPGAKLVAQGRKLIERFPALAARPAYQKLLARLTKVTGKKPKAYANPHGSAYGKLKGVYAVTVPAKSLAAEPALLAELAAAATAAGGTFVQAVLGPDEQANGVPCILFPTTDKTAVVLAQETSSNGIPGADAEDIVAFIADLDQRQPFRLTVCTHDAIAGAFAGPVRQAKTVARRLLAICPGDDDHAPDEVAAALRQDRCFTLWWD